MLRKVLEECPDFAEAHYSLGKVFLEAGNLSEAIRRLEDAVRLNPASVHAYYTLARAYQQGGRVVEARRQFALTRDLKEKNHLAHSKPEPPPDAVE